MARERRMVRKPAIKFPQLRKKLEQAKLSAMPPRLRLGKRKKPG